MTLKQRYHKIILTQLLPEAYISSEHIELEYGKQFYFSNYDNIEQIIEAIEEYLEDIK